jgi:Bax protein
MNPRAILSFAIFLGGMSFMARGPIARTLAAIENAASSPAVVFTSTDLQGIVEQSLADGPPYRVPRVVPATLPPDIERLAPGQRKRVFITTILPLVLAENERVLRDRAELLRLLGHETLSETEQRWLAALLKRYRINPPAQAGPELIAQALLRRLDEVPVSMALAQAALESGWGTSRAAQEGNALFGQYAFMGPAGGSYELKGFVSLQDCINDYVRNLNSHPAYSEFRALRLAQRRGGDGLDPFALASTLTRYSSRGVDYTEHVHEMMLMNDLRRYDAASLCAVDDAVVASLVPAPAGDTFANAQVSEAS